MSADVFISFASKDRKVATTLCASLESRGVKCWISARDILPGENFQVSIVQAIRQAKIMLLVFTGNSNTSEEMTKELALASQQRLIVIPLRIEDVTPNDAFAYEFATRQWIDFFADWEIAIDQLCHRISNALLVQASPAPAVDPLLSAVVADETDQLDAQAAPPAPVALNPFALKARPPLAEASSANDAQPAEASEEFAPPRGLPIGRLALIAAAIAVSVGLGLMVPGML